MTTIVYKSSFIIYMVIRISSSQEQTYSWTTRAYTWSMVRLPVRSKDNSIAGMYGCLKNAVTILAIQPIVRENFDINN